MRYLFIILFSTQIYSQDLMLLFESGLDTIPAPFTFTDVTGATLDSAYTSNAIVPTRFDSAYASAGTDSFKVGALGSWRVDAIIVDKLDTVYVKKVSSASELTTVSATLTIGKTSDIYSITTKQVSDTTPPSAPTGVNATNITRD